MLTRKRGLIVGVANDRSIAYGCARRFRAEGADLAITYLNEKTEEYVRPLAAELQCDIARQCDVSAPGRLESVFEEIATKWRRLDFALHSIGFARSEDLHGRLIDCSAEGFAYARQVSVHSFLRMAKLAEPLMTDGGCLLAFTFHGAEKVMPHYGVMGPVKAALESAVKYMAAELGARKIRVNAISPGPVATRSALGLSHFDDLLNGALEKAPEHRLITADDVGALAAFLVSDDAAAITGNISYVDGGYHVMA
jgi:enoyl-[acyl-carrier protein] reductase I